MKPSAHRFSHSPVLISWEQILNNLEDGVVITDQHGVIVFFNEAAEVLTQTSAGQATGLDLNRLFRPWLLEVVGKTRPPRQDSARADGDLVTRRGRIVPVSVTASPMRDDTGEFVGTILLVRDMTRRRDLEQDLKRADRLAMMGTLAAGLAHEIRNPLGGIKGAAQLLRRSIEANSALREYTDIMIREVERVNNLIEQLLDLSRPRELHLAALNIHEVLDDVIMLEMQSAADRITVKKWLDPSLPPIRGDRSQLTQVFLNLIKNAFQSMERGGTLTITTRLETDYHLRGPESGSSRLIWVEISDEGHGIREEDLTKIFSPFFTTKNSGTGLGLAICYAIVKEHGGTIRVDSSEGKGTTFKVSLLVAD